MKEMPVTLIRPKSGWFDLPVKELFRYKDLILLFVKRDFVSLYKQTVLGPAWAVIQPFLTTIVFSLVFGSIAGLAPEGVPSFLFYLSGTVVWTYFANCLTRTSDTFIANAAILGKVYFPRLVMPVSTVLSKLIDFAIQYGFFLVFLVILQQLEGNLIYPRVVGSSMGLPGIWVLAAVVVGGGVAGIWGMLLGVPLAAAAYRMIRHDMRKHAVKEAEASDAETSEKAEAAAPEAEPETPPAEAQATEKKAKKKSKKA